MTGGWHASPTFLLRRAGFPFAALGVAAGGESARQAERLVQAEDASEAGRSRLLAELFPAAVAQARAERPAELKALSRARKKVGARSAAELPDSVTDPELLAEHRVWLDLNRQLDRVRGELERAVDADRGGCSDRLRELAGRPDVREAVFVLSPSFSDALARYLDSVRSAHQRGDRHAFDRRLYAFLQRLAGKNETNSFFGPVTFGRFAGERPAFGPEQVEGFRERRAYVSFWAAVEIGKAAVRRPGVAAEVPVRRLPVARIDGDRALVPGRPAVPLTADDRLLLQSLDGRRTSLELSAVTGLGRDQVRERLRRLARSAVLQRSCEPSSTSVEPLTDVLAQLPDSSEAKAIRVRVEELQRVVREYAATPLPDRQPLLAQAELIFSELTGRPARRNAGGTYADRSILFEDCVGDLMPVSLPETWRARIERQLAPVLDLGLAAGEAQRDAHRELARRVLADPGGSGSVPALR